MSSFIDTKSKEISWKNVFALLGVFSVVVAVIAITTIFILQPINIVSSAASNGSLGEAGAPFTSKDTLKSKNPGDLPYYYRGRIRVDNRNRDFTATNVIVSSIFGNSQPTSIPPLSYRIFSFPCNPPGVAERFESFIVYGDLGSQPAQVEYIWDTKCTVTEYYGAAELSYVYPPSPPIIPSNTPAYPTPSQLPPIPTNTPRPTSYPTPTPVSCYFTRSSQSICDNLCYADYSRGCIKQGSSWCCPR